MTPYLIGEAMTETFTGTVSEMRVDRADYRCADCDDGDECCGCCECTFRTTPGLYLTVRLDDDRVGLHAGRVRVTYESPDQPEPAKPSREAVRQAIEAAFGPTWASAIEAKPAALRKPGGSGRTPRMSAPTATGFVPAYWPFSR